MHVENVYCNKVKAGIRYSLLKSFFSLVYMGTRFVEWPNKEETESKNRFINNT